MVQAEQQQRALGKETTEKAVLRGENSQVRTIRNLQQTPNICREKISSEVGFADRD